jgi:hypothetical protein
MSDIERDNFASQTRESSDKGLRDIFLALKYLKPQTEETKNAIVKALGFELLAAASRESGGDSMDGGLLENLPKREPRTTLPTPSAAASTAQVLEPQLETEAEPAEIFGAVDWEEIEVLAETEDVVEPLTRYVSLFNENWFRAIMSLLLSTQTPSTELDLKLIEKGLIQMSPIARVPYRFRRSLERGVQILLDISESMQPFWRDEAELVAALSHLIDKHKMRVSEFEIFSQRQIVWQEESQELLEPEIPLLLVTNFGVSNEETMPLLRNNESMLRLLAQAKSKKCPVIALVPLPEQFFSPDLKSFIPFSFVWDRPTSPQVVSRIKRY